MRFNTKYIFSLFVIVTLLFIGCSESEDNPTSTNTEEESPENVLKGKWKLVYSQDNEKRGGTDSLLVNLEINGSDNDVNGLAYIYYSWSDGSNYASEGSLTEYPEQISGWYNDDSITVIAGNEFAFKGEKTGMDYRGRGVHVTPGLVNPVDTIIVDGQLVHYY